VHTSVLLCVVYVLIRHADLSVLSGDSPDSLWTIQQVCYCAWCTSSCATVPVGQDPCDPAEVGGFEDGPAHESWVAHSLLWGFWFVETRPSTALRTTLRARGFDLQNRARCNLMLRLRSA